MLKTHRSQLAVIPKTIDYRASENPEAEHDLLQALDDITKATQLSLVAREQDVLLYRNLKIRGVFQLTTVALEHLCSRLAPRLYQAIVHVAGIRTNKRSVDRDILYSDDAAASIINRLIKLRFNNIRGYRLLLNHQTKLADGLIGRNYEFYSNREFYQTAMDFVGSQFPAAQFWEASLSGRRLLFRLIDPEPLVLKLPGYGTEMFYRGFHFSNAEIGGFALRAANVVVHARTGGVAISPFVNGGKISHIQSQNFFQQLQSLFTRVAQRGRPSIELERNLVTVARTGLRLIENQEVNESRKELIAGQLQRRGLTRDLADVVIARTILTGADSNTPAWSGADLTRDRTAFDVFLALMIEAKEQRLKVREHTEQVAYDVLSGKLVLSAPS